MTDQQLIGIWCCLFEWRLRAVLQRPFLVLFSLQSVKDNILCYDPVDGIYGIQGKSLEWGIKGYFEETKTDNLSAKNAEFSE